MAVFVILYIAFIVAAIAGMWKGFEKAGQPGWAAIIPIYNFYILTKIGEKPWWWMLLMLIPIVNFVVLIILSLAIAERYGKGPGFGVGLALLAPIFWMILGFGDAQYRGSSPAAPSTF